MEKHATCNKDVAETNVIEVIEVEDDLETPNTIDKRPTTSAELTDKTKLCEHPVGSINSVTVCFADYTTLKPGTFLNDIMIDFYLTYLYHKSLSNEKKSSVHIFSTMFYKRLISPPPHTNIQAMPSYETDPNVSEAEKQHSRVKGWTKNCNLFEKVLLVIPICENSHWYLIIAVRPGSFMGPVDTEDIQIKGKPFMLVLDSLGGSNSSAVTNIRQYLSEEWKAKMMESVRDFSDAEIEAVTPEKPEQDNYTDCGIYLLEYVEKIFKIYNSGTSNFYSPMQDIRDWFDTKEISSKRSKLGILVRKLAAEQDLVELNILDVTSAPAASDRNQYFRESSGSDDDGSKDDLDICGLAAAGFYGERSLNNIEQREKFTQHSCKEVDNLESINRDDEVVVGNTLVDRKDMSDRVKLEVSKGIKTETSDKVGSSRLERVEETRSKGLELIPSRKQTQQLKANIPERKCPGFNNNEKSDFKTNVLPVYKKLLAKSNDGKVKKYRSSAMKAFKEGVNDKGRIICSSRKNDEALKKSINTILQELPLLDGECKSGNKVQMQAQEGVKAERTECKTVEPATKNLHL